jgi:hypothetical protein
MRSIFLEQKGIPVEDIIQKRGIELGFEPNDFLIRLLRFHAVSIICWGLVFFWLNTSLSQEKTIFLLYTGRGYLIPWNEFFLLEFQLFPIRYDNF